MFWEIFIFEYHVSIPPPSIIQKHPLQKLFPYKISKGNRWFFNAFFHHNLIKGNENKENAEEMYITVIVPFKLNSAFFIKDLGHCVPSGPRCFYVNLGRLCVLNLSYLIYNMWRWLLFASQGCGDYMTSCTWTV